jgi:hypothetical protein
MFTLYLTSLHHEESSVQRKVSCSMLRTRHDEIMFAFQSFFFWITPKKRHMSAACRMSGACQAKLGRHVCDKLRIRTVVCFCFHVYYVCQSSCLLRSRLIWWQAWKVVSHRFKIILLRRLWKLLNCSTFCRKDYVINVLRGLRFSGLCLHVEHILWRMFVRNVGKCPPV